MRSVLSLKDLTDEEIDAVLGRAEEHRSGRCGNVSGRSRVLGLLFLEPSLRTRVGFAVAAARLGWHSVDVLGPRRSRVSMPESFEDTLRTVAGYSDAIVTRPGRPLSHGDARAVAPCPVVNGGDVGASAEHPSQALIDVFAMEHLVGALDRLSIAIVGDPRMRAVRSLLELLARRPPGELWVIADPSHLGEIVLPADLKSTLRVTSWSQLGECDVLYVAGIPHEALPLERRNDLLATQVRATALAPHCVLLSPMPIIDEMDEAVKGSKRNKMFEQSDLGVYVRMALLEFVVESASRPVSASHRLEGS